MRFTKWAIFISGTGSNLQALLDLATEARPTLVISNQVQAPGLGKARRMGIPTLVIKNPIDWNFISNELKNFGIQKIFLLGFMKILPASFISGWQNKILNLHPSLLPLYPGLHAFEKAYQDKKPLGATVHRVVAQVDAGPQLLQKKFSRDENYNECRLRLSWTEQCLVREVFVNESF